MSRRLMLRNASGGGGGLPSEYQQVEWIGRSNNSQAYINTNLFSTSHTQIETKLSFDVSNACNLFGNYCIGLSIASNLFRFLTGASVKSTDIPVVVNDIYIISMKLQNGNVELTVNNEVRSTTFHNSDYKRILLFTATSPWGDTPLNNSFVGKLHGNTTVYINGSVAGEFIPCYRKSDGEIGMYDTVSATFFTNAGTGTFTKGADVI